MLTVDPKSFTQSDHSTMDAMFERNRTRIREIEAVIGELEPVLSRLLEERSACFEVMQRCARSQCIGSGQFGSGKQMRPDDVAPTAGKNQNFS